MAATVGPPVPAVATLGRELRQSLPPGLVEALDKITSRQPIERIAMGEFRNRLRDGILLGSGGVDRLGE
jgi:hypothetical protein